MVPPGLQSVRCSTDLQVFTAVYPQVSGDRQQRAGWSSPAEQHELAQLRGIVKETAIAVPWPSQTVGGTSYGALTMAVYSTILLALAVT
jgi:hypothetical protein